MIHLYLKRLVLSILILATVFTAGAQLQPSYTSADIYLKIKKLKVLGTVLYIAAHPDDENTRLLAYLSKEKLYRTGYLSLTRGDGGQNLIGDEQGVDLGLIRTQELLAARRMDGAEQFFSRAFDFGFSKSTDEALATWGRDKIISDAVWVIRKFQPDVIITRFPPDARAGHGHHSGSSVVAHEAFKAAADPNRFPEQFKYGVKPWKVKRIFWNTYNFGGNNTTRDDQLHIDVGGYSPILGKSYGEIAAESRSQHKSQGFGVPGSRGVQLEYFSLTDGEAAQNDLMDGVNIAWTKVKGGEAIDGMIDEILKSFSLANPEQSVPALVDLYKKMASLEDSNWKKKKMEEVQELVEWCSGLWLDAYTNTEYAVQGDSVRVNFSVNNRLGADISIQKISLDETDAVLNKKTGRNENTNLFRNIYISPSKPITQPYWLEQKKNEGSYIVEEQTLIGLPENEPAYQAKFSVTVNGQAFTFIKPVQYRYTDRVKGELRQPLVVVPSTVVSTEPGIVILRNYEKQGADIMIRLTANKDLENYTAKVSKRLTYDNSTQTVDNLSLKAGFSRQFIFPVDNTMLKGLEEDYIQAFAELKKGNTEAPSYLNLTSITYDHIPHIHYFYQDAIKVLNIDLKTVGKKIGYIEGAGDKVPIALEQMGYEVTELKEKDITAGYLTQFDAVITGVRAYNVHDFLETKYDVLMDYVKNGGNLIVQYNTSGFNSSVSDKLGPYPFTISRNRVTDETAKVNFLLPDHPVLNYPNKITGKDFENWIQERGLYFVENPDPHYQLPLSMSDPGEEAQRGSLIIADYGKGKFVYTGLVFFRELPAGVAGAYRLLANIIALTGKKGF